MSETKAKIPPVVLAVFLVGEVVMFGGGWVLGNAMGKSSAAEDAKVSGPTAGKLEADKAELARKNQSLTDDLGASQARVAELTSKLAEASKRPSEGDSSATAQNAEAVHAALAKSRELSEQVESLKRERDETKAANAKLTAELARVEGIAFPGKPSILYGAWAEMQELRTSNWSEAGEAAAGMSGKTLKALYDHLMLGKGWAGIDPQVMEDIQNQNLKLVELAGKFNKKTPTHADNVNGSFAHPILQFNLLASALSKAGVPLSEHQTQELARIGADYDDNYEGAQAGYSAETLHLKKLVDEIELKMVASNAMERLLTEPQKQAAFPPGMRHLSSFDIYSPAIMLMTHVGPVTGGDRPELVNALMNEASDTLGFDAEAIKSQGQLFEQFLNECSSLLTPMDAMHAQMLHTGNDALLAGKAQLKLMESLISLTRPSEESLTKIRAASRIAVPRILKPAK